MPDRKGHAHVIRMAVLSDSHASAGSRETTSASTWVRTANDDPADNPLAGLPSLITNTPDLTADVLLCPGDLCDKAEWGALPWMWDQLSELGQHLGAKTILATVGNHDIDSHGRHLPNPVDHGLRELDPPFPVRKGVAAGDFWDERISVAEGDDWQIVVLNSSLMRALDVADGEKDHGEIDDRTLTRLKERLAHAAFPVNVLLCHHHPQPSTHLSPEDRSHMENGDRLVRLLDDLPTNWFVVHGHKHEPDLDYFGGTSEAPIRLASGSVGANLRGSLGSHVRNQFHLIEFPISRCKEIDLSLGGWVRSWTWQPRTGWRQALKDGDGLPAVAGFGHKMPPRDLAHELVRWARDQALYVVEREALLRHAPKFEFMLPRDVQRFVEILEDELGCAVQFNRHGNFARLVLA